jgi:hypothetical protein
VEHIIDVGNAKSRPRPDPSMNLRPGARNRNPRRVEMHKKVAVLALVLVLAMAAVVPAFAKGRGGGALGTVYVTSQGLYFDTFVSAEELPMKGRFQKLVAGVTEFGPGDPGYLGGRWWIDNNGNDIQDAGDTFLLCPLLGPGRVNP